METLIVDTMDVEDNSRPENKVVLYPNPANEFLNVSRASDIHLEEVIIYDLQGRIVHKLSGDVDTIYVDHLSSGIYMVEIKSDKNTLRKRIVKK